MRKIIRGCLVIIATVLILVFLPLQEAAAAASAPTIKVGYFDYPGFIEEDGNKQFSGYGYDYLEEISNYTAWGYSFVYGSWEDCLKRLQKGEIDLLCTAQYTKERAEQFDYAKYNSGVEYAALYVEKDNDSIFYEDATSFQGLKIAFLKDSYQNKLFEEYAKMHSFTYKSLFYATASDCVIAMRSGEADAVLSGNLRKTNNEKVVAKFSPDPFYFITTKGNTAVMAGVNSAMEAIRTTDINFNAKLYDKYYGESGSNQLALTRIESDYIKAHPTLVVASNEDWAPVEYWDENKKTFTGISHDLMQTISRQSGITFSYKRAANFDEARELVDSGQADLLSSYSRENLQTAKQSGLLITKPYLEIPVMLAIRKGLHLDKVKTLAVPEHCRGMGDYSEDIIPWANVVFFPSTKSCLKAVNNREADAVFENSYILNQYLNDTRYGGLELVYSNRSTHPLSIGLSADKDIVLLSILNKAIGQISTEEINHALVNNTINVPEIYSLAVAREYGLPFLLVISVVILLAVMRSKRAVEKVAYLDQLTGCKNQTKFQTDAEKLLRGKKTGAYAIISLDVDKFKLINDMHGYSVGNEILIDEARVIKNALQGEEIFCRASGDIFLLLLRCEGYDALMGRVNRLINQICEVPAKQKRTVKFVMSAGIYVVNEPITVNSAIDRASLARHTVKGEHKDFIAYYDASMRDKILREKEIENRMESALRNKEFVVFYQPKYSLEDQKIVGAEALVRWIYPDGTIIYPDEFIPVFETNSFIINLDLYVFAQVCADLRGWLNMGIYPFPISVNMSRVHLYQTDFQEKYIRIMKKYCIPAYLIELELTENAIFDNKIQFISIMKKLKESGLSLSMDDFGSGYSSLNLLKDMPIDFLKIDRGFFNTTSDTERGKMIISSVVSMARQLNICVVSEGVETQEQVEFLKEIHCDVVQGYYFSKAVTKKEYENLAFPGEKFDA